MVSKHGIEDEVCIVEREREKEKEREMMALGLRSSNNADDWYNDLRSCWRCLCGGAWKRRRKINNDVLLQEGTARSERERGCKSGGRP